MTGFSAEREKIIGKIRAMYAKGRDRASTPEEADAFMRKANEMLIAYNIQEFEVNGGQVDSLNIDGEYCKVAVDLSHQRRLAQFVAKYYFCALAWGKLTEEGRSTKQPYYVFVGKPHNRVVAKEMFEYLARTCRRLAVRERDSVKDRNDYVKGMMLRLAHRLFELIKAREVQPSGSTELIVLNDEIAQAQQFIEKSFVLNAVTVAKPSITESNQAGWNDGKNVSLNEQVGNSQTKGIE